MWHIVYLGKLSNKTTIDHFNVNNFNQLIIIINFSCRRVNSHWIVLYIFALNQSQSPFHSDWKFSSLFILYPFQMLTTLLHRISSAIYEIINNKKKKIPIWKGKRVNVCISTPPPLLFFCIQVLVELLSSICSNVYRKYDELCCSLSNFIVIYIKIDGKCSFHSHTFPRFSNSPSKWQKCFCICFFLYSLLFALYFLLIIFFL